MSSTQDLRRLTPDEGRTWQGGMPREEREVSKGWVDVMARGSKVVYAWSGEEGSIQASSTRPHGEDAISLKITLTA